MVEVIHGKLKQNETLRKQAMKGYEMMFVKSQFKKPFDDAAADAYNEQTEAFTTLFQNDEKYKSVMEALAHVMFKEFRASA